MYTIKQTRFNGDVKIRAHHFISNESGVALMVVIVAMILLSAIAGIAIKSSRDEVQIAANDRQYQITKAEADGATELASELLEQNIACPSGFTNMSRGGTIQVIKSDFWINGRSGSTTPVDKDLATAVVSGDSDFYLPIGYSVGDPHTNFNMGGYTRWGHGAAIQMAAGYRGKGKGAGSGGGQRMYEILTQRKGEMDSETICRTEWQHVIGAEGICIDY